VIGVLDRLAHLLRPAEFAQPANAGAGVAPGNAGVDSVSAGAAEE
jgi:hypothetical protein